MPGELQKGLQKEEHNAYEQQEKRNRKGRSSWRIFETERNAYFREEFQIDIIGFHNGYLVFVEVKYRKNERRGFPEEAVHREKQRKISNVARVYLYKNKVRAEQPVRFDVVAICGEQIKWYQNAFLYCAAY